MLPAFGLLPQRACVCGVLQVTLKVYLRVFNPLFFRYCPRPFRATLAGLLLGGDNSRFFSLRRPVPLFMHEVGVPADSIVHHFFLFNCFMSASTTLLAWSTLVAVLRFQVIRYEYMLPLCSLSALLEKRMPRPMKPLGGERGARPTMSKACATYLHHNWDWETNGKIFV